MRDEASPRLVIPGGFIFKDGDIVNTDACIVNAPRIAFSNRDTGAFNVRVTGNC